VSLSVPTRFAVLNHLINCLVYSIILHGSVGSHLAVTASTSHSTKDHKEEDKDGEEDYGDGDRDDDDPDGDYDSKLPVMPNHTPWLLYSSHSTMDHDTHEDGDDDGDADGYNGDNDTKLLDMSHHTPWLPCSSCSTTYHDANDCDCYMAHM